MHRGTEALYKLLPTVQLDCDLLYRLRCYSKETPNTGSHKAEVYFSLSLDLLGLLCGP